MAAFLLSFSLSPLILISFNRLITTWAKCFSTHYIVNSTLNVPDPRGEHSTNYKYTLLSSSLRDDDYDDDGE